MGHKKRGYDKDSDVYRPRDYTLFAIACEGAVREREYFQLFSQISTRIKVDLIPEQRPETKGVEHKSAPQWVLSNAINYTEEQLGWEDGDELWLVIDVDRWRNEDLQQLIEECRNRAQQGWNIAISNPCFEVWLCYHHLTSLDKVDATKSQEFKSLLPSLCEGGYNPYKVISKLPDAIENAKRNDTNKNAEFPSFKETKVYQLTEALLDKIGKNTFDAFINTKLPLLKKRNY
jgi:hypothetical protein